MAPPRMTRPYTFVTPSGETVRLLTTDVSGGTCPFDTWPDAKQNEYLHLMQGHLKDLYMDGSPAHYYELTGITMGDGSSLDTTQIAFYREDLIDGTSWKITQALRKTRPTRIAEAVDLIKFVIERQKRINNGTLREALPPFYLGVAYSNIPGQEDHAIAAFTEGFQVFDAIPQGNIALNELWARSHFARVLRQKGRIQEAMHQELRTRQWIIGHLAFCAPSTFKKNIEGPWGTGEHITDHGDVLEEFSQIEELDPANAIWHKGGQTIVVNYGRKN